MSEKGKWKEGWISPKDMVVYPMCDDIKVIEYGAYEDLKKKAEALIEALEFYKAGKVMSVTGKINTAVAIKALADWAEGGGDGSE